jgi:hypothetical protein
LQAKKRDTGLLYAVKIIERSNAAFDIEALKKEIDTMQRIVQILNKVPFSDFVS